MSSENKFSKEDAFRALEITNTWINNVDTKVSFALTYMAVLIGFVFYNAGAIPNAFQSFLDADHKCCDVILGAILVLCLFFCCLSSVLLFFLALFGRVKNKSGENSVFFFGTVSVMKLDDYRAKAMNMTNQDIEQDILEQVHTNSRKCMAKFKFYNQGIYLSIASTVLCFICMIFQLI